MQSVLYDNFNRLIANFLHFLALEMFAVKNFKRNLFTDFCSTRKLKRKIVLPPDNVDEQLRSKAL